MDPDIIASMAINNKNNIWVRDSLAKKCWSCNIDFSLLVRKHHCRSCGNIFCFACSNNMIIIPKIISDRPNPADYWNLSHYVTYLKGKKERVCSECYLSIREKIKAFEKIAKIFNNPITIDEVKNLSESNKDVKNHYFDHFRNIQYYLPDHEYSGLDKKLLTINAPYLSGHSKYLLHLIKSIDWSDTNDDSQVEFVFSVINGEKNKECCDLFCTRTCNEGLSCDDCVNILYSCHNTLPNELIRYLFSIIKLTPENVILCHLTFFINIIKNNNNNKLLQLCLLELLSMSKKLIYHTIWFLMHAKENAISPQTKNINNFLNLYNKELIEEMTTGRNFFVGLINNLDDPVHYLKNNKKYLGKIVIPYEPNKYIVGIDYDNISDKSSFTKPVVIPFYVETYLNDNESSEDDGNNENNCDDKNTESHENRGDDNSSTVKVIKEKINILFKKESVLNDVIVLNLMTLCDIIMEETLDIQFGAVIYPVMPITSDSGMIQIVDDAETIYSIMNRKKTIFQSICEKNEDKPIGMIMDKYMYSLVSYTLHSYFIGLGDRHLQNIMIRDDGSIFHIDFGFILGTDAYPVAKTDIKLNCDMLDAIGGTDSSRYQTYLDLCSQGVIVLRKYFNLFYILFSQNINFKKNTIHGFILSRFQPKQNDYDVITGLMIIIERSNNAYSAMIRDFLHYHNQEKTVQNGFKKTIKAAVNTVKKFGSSN